MQKRVVIIGAGIGGLSAACYLSKAGYDVVVTEKNDHAGGRAMVERVDGFTFDLGPSWYMMPDVFEEFFDHFGKKTADYYDLVKLDPSYKVFTGDACYDVQTAPAVYDLFEQLEPGSSKQLEKLPTVPWRFFVRSNDLKVSAHLEPRSKSCQPRLLPQFQHAHHCS